MNKNKSGRRHVRTPIRTKVKLGHNELGELMVFSGNISDGGVYVELTASEKPQVGDVVSIQIQGLPIEAPVVPARVVRIEESGLGLEFLEQD